MRDLAVNNSKYSFCLAKLLLLLVQQILKNKITQTMAAVFCSTCISTSYDFAQVWPEESVFPDFTNIENATKFWKKWIQYFNDTERVHIDGLWIVSTSQKPFYTINQSTYSVLKLLVQNERECRIKVHLPQKKLFSSNLR